LGHEAGDLDAVDIIDDPDRQKGQKLARLNTTIAASQQRVQELVKSLDAWLHHEAAERPKRTQFLRDLEAEVGGNIVPRCTLTIIETWAHMGLPLPSKAALDLQSSARHGP
jgi:hypothetical protein